MIEKIYLSDYILSYLKVNNYLELLTNSSSYKYRLHKEQCKGITCFNYPINSYKLGYGKKHVIMIGATHGCELVTVNFVLEMILTLVNDNELYNNICNKYTFHFIPILNPEGYIISSSNVLNNNVNSKEDLEKLASIYLEKYNIDDEIAKKGLHCDKLFTTVLNTSTSCIQNIAMERNIDKILKTCKLNSSYLPVWTANGMGVDQNSNSIHKFCDMIKLRSIQKCANLRYNNIPVTKPSPMSFPGCASFEKRCPENISLYNYISKFYNLNNDQNIKDKLIAIFSYHSTGGEIYGYPDKAYASCKQIKLHEKAMSVYSKYTNYNLIDEKLKYGVMDFYRIYLENVVSLTIELSKINGNPIGPYSNISSLQNEIILNKKAVIETINYL